MENSSSEGKQVIAQKKTKSLKLSGLNRQGQSLCADCDP